MGQNRDTHQGIGGDKCVEESIEAFISCLLGTEDTTQTLCLLTPIHYEHMCILRITPNMKNIQHLIARYSPAAVL